MATRYNYTSDKQITALKVDSSNNFAWMAFAKNSDNKCIIEKQFGFNPFQTFFTLERSVEEVTAMDLNSTHLFVAYNDSTLLGEKISLSNPLTSTTEISLPAVNEYPIDLHINGSDVWFLLPGSTSGNVATLLQYNTSGTLVETIELIKSGAEIVNASSFTIDGLGDLWVVTDTSPANVVRVYEDSASIWNFDITEIS